MIRMHLVDPAAVTGLCAAAMVLCAAPASAKDTKRACTPAFVAYKEAARQLNDGHLHEAREQLQACLQSSCAGLRPKCSAMNVKLLAAMPTVVFAVTDAAGNPQTDVRVTVDGELVTSKLDGMALPVEPGVREFTFATDAGVFAKQRVMLLEGQRDRPIEVTMNKATPAAQTAPAARPVAMAATMAPMQTPAAEKAASDEKPAPDGPSQDERSVEGPPRTEAAPRESTRDGSWALPHSALPYILGGAGVAAVVAGGLLTYWGNKDNTELENQCKPNCNPSDADHVKALYVASDISFGVGLAALGVTTWLFASSRSAERAAAPSAAALSVTPTPSGAFASVSGAF
jgi:hypothetical protein